MILTFSLSALHDDGTLTGPMFSSQSFSKTSSLIKLGRTPVSRMHCTWRIICDGKPTEIGCLYFSGEKNNGMGFKHTSFEVRFRNVLLPFALHTFRWCFVFSLRWWNLRATILVLCWNSLVTIFNVRRYFYFALVAWRGTLSRLRPRFLCTRR